MSVQHKYLASGHWSKFSFNEQMANIGSEVERALSWETKKNKDYSQRAFERALELIDLTLESLDDLDRLKELTRVREGLVDYFVGLNKSSSSESIWRKYFYFFNYEVRKNY